MRNCVALAFLFAVTMAAHPTARAGSVAIATQVFIDSLEATTTELISSFGLDTTSINFNVSVGADGDSFAYSTVAGSTYLGQALSMSAAGSLDATTGDWTWTLNAMLGSSAFGANGLATTETHGNFTRISAIANTGGNLIVVSSGYNGQTGDGPDASGQTTQNGTPVSGTSRASADSTNPNNGTIDQKTKPSSSPPPKPPKESPPEKPPQEPPPEAHPPPYDTSTQGQVPVNGGYGRASVGVTGMPEPSGLVTGGIAIAGLSIAAASRAGRRRRAAR